jgi:hypothetical protein
MRRSQAGLRAQAGTSVLAALVFVAIFVLFISGYKIASQGAVGQSAAVASAPADHVVKCTGGQVYTVNMEYGSGLVEASQCTKNSDGTCAQAVPGKCALRYCPPASYVSESGTCIVAGTCDPADEQCLKGAVQNASQPQQAASILATQLMADKGETSARTLNSSAPVLLADILSESGRVAVSSVIESTAVAAAESGLDGESIRAIARAISTRAASAPLSGAVAQISCQPKIAEAGMKVGIAFGCVNSTVSEGGGFSTGGRLWGATEESLPGDLPNGTMIYALRCSDGQRSVSASCSVAVMKPFMLLTSQTEGTDASFAWVTRGMDVCDLSAPNNPELNAQFVNPVPQSGVLTVSSLTADTQVTLACTSVSGTVKELTTTVRVQKN